MMIFKKSFISRRWFTALISAMLMILMPCMIINAQSSNEKSVRLVRNDDQRKVDVYVNGTLFTAFQYPKNFEKAFLYPLYAPNGSVITRGFPLEARKGERIDHPHHVGLWFNHGNVNGLDFWNNSSAIPAEEKDSYGKIVFQEIVSTQSGKKGVLEVVLNWNDNSGNTLLTENTSYIFSFDKNSRTIDHISTLTAVNGPVKITDSKEGFFAIRVDRAFEMPSNEALVFTDEKGNPTTVAALDNTGVTGMYISSNGLKGDAVWGTRNKWILLTGVKDDSPITLGIFDHPENPGFPAYAHARGYGLFSVNNIGQNSYDPSQEKVIYNLNKGESITLKHRFYVQSGSELKAGKAEKIFNEFSKSY